MADYEVLAPGGHAHLVSDVKSYADRAGGKGTTQLADGSVTRDKLADGVTDRIDAMHGRCDPLVGNYFFNELAENTVLTADDVYTAPPKGVSVFGVSTQAGTPTPDAPVEIKSVDDLTLVFAGKNMCPRDAIDHYTIGPSGEHVTDSQYTRVVSEPIPCNPSTAYIFTSLRLAFLSIGFYDASDTFITRSAINTASSQTYTTMGFTTPSNAEYMVVSAQPYSETNVSIANAFYNFNCQLELGTTATAYEPYVGQSVEIPLSDHIARSLPDGTRDTLTLSYVGPSTREGWGVFGAELNKQTESATFDGTETWVLDSNNRLYTEEVSSLVKKPPSNQVGIRTNCSMGVWSSINNLQSSSNRLAVAQSGRIFINLDNIATVAQITALLQETPMQFDYPLATSQTIDLGTIELPANPAPDLTAWADGGSAQPTMAMSYEQDINIVIARLEDAIADLATA